MGKVERWELWELEMWAQEWVQIGLRVVVSAAVWEVGTNRLPLLPVGHSPAQWILDDSGKEYSGSAVVVDNDSGPSFDVALDYCPVLDADPGRSWSELAPGPVGPFEVASGRVGSLRGFP